MGEIGRNLENTDVLRFHTTAERIAFEEDISKFYGASLKCSELGALGFSHTSRKIILVGLSGDTYVFKQKPFYCRDEYSLCKFVAVQNACYDTTRIAPRVIEGAKGYFYYIDGIPHFMTRYVIGTHYNGSLEHSLASAKALRKFHDALAPYTYEALGCGPSTPLRSTAGAESFLLILEERLRKLGLDQALSTKLAELRGVLDYLISEENKCPVNAYMWIHGDPNPFNFGFVGAEVASLNDFDNVAYASRDRDVGILLLTNCNIYYWGSTTTLRLPIQRTVDLRRVGLMAKAYWDGVTPFATWKRTRLEMQIHWFELMVLGVVRGDFEMGDACETLSVLDTLGGLDLER